MLVLVFILQLTKCYCSSSYSGQRLKTIWVLSFVFIPASTWWKSSDLGPLSLPGVSSRSFHVLLCLCSHVTSLERPSWGHLPVITLCLIFFLTYIIIWNYIFITSFCLPCYKFNDSGEHCFIPSEQNDAKNFLGTQCVFSGWMNESFLESQWNWYCSISILLMKALRLRKDKTFVLGDVVRE